MKKIFFILICMLLAGTMTACGSPKDEAWASSETQGEQAQDTARKEPKRNSAKVSSDNGTKEEKVTEQELFDAFLKDQAEVHFNNYQPEKYYKINEFMFGNLQQRNIDLPDLDGQELELLREPGRAELVRRWRKRNNK